MIRKIAYKLRTLLFGDKMTLTGNIITNLTDNPAFEDPNPSLADLTAKKAACAAKHMEVEDLKSALATASVQEDMLLAELDAMLNDLADYAQNVTGGDADLLLSGGFPLAKLPAPIGMLPAPTGMVVTPGNTGSCTLRWKRDRGTSSFVGQCATSEAGPWTQFYNGTSSRCTADGLVSGTQYWFRVAAIGAAGQSDWSDPVPKRAA